MAMTFFLKAKTNVIAPTLVCASVKFQRLLMIAVLFHRDPCVQSGNVISMEKCWRKSLNMTHIHPMTVSQVDGDPIRDSASTNGFKNLRLDDAQDEFFNKVIRLWTTNR